MEIHYPLLNVASWAATIVAPKVSKSKRESLFDLLGQRFGRLVTASLWRGASTAWDADGIIAAPGQQIDHTNRQGRRLSGEQSPPLDQLAAIPRPNGDSQGRL
jgi:hypothetical protein